MPRNVRNFWVELNVDGNSPVATGPRSKDGGFELNILMRDAGQVKKALRIVGTALEDGTLELDVLPFEGAGFTLEGDAGPDQRHFTRTRR